VTPRVLCYNHAAEVSGAERSLLSIMMHARSSGYRLLLCAPPGALSDEAAVQGLRTLPVALLALGYARNPLVLARSLARAAAPVLDLARAVRRTRPDLVYANSIRSGLVAAMALRLARPRPRLVVHARDALGDGPLDRLTARVIGRWSDAVVAISAYVAQGFARDAGADKLHVLHNAIDPNRYRFDAGKGRAFRASLGVAPDAPLLAVVGQLTPWKGQQDALEAFALLRRSMPEAHLVVAGSAKFTGKHRRYDTVAYRDALLARAQESDLRGHVHFPGDVADVVAVYSAADLLVVPSWAEPFGRVVIEGMAASTPVLATAAGGVPEIITHGVDGWLVPPRDRNAMVEAMKRLLTDSALRARLDANGRVTVRERFSLPRYTTRLTSIWNAVDDGTASPDGSRA